MSAPPLVPSRLYGLRTWTAVGEQGEERLAGPQAATPWPVGGAWLSAECSAREHAAPAPDCACGLHAWHPGPGAARQLVRRRFAVPGVLEAEGAIELHRDGFRAARGRPYALFAAPRSNAARIARLAAAYDAEVVRVDDAEAIVAFCRARGLGLEPAAVERLLGPEVVAATDAERRRRVRGTALRLAAVLALIGAFVAAGLAATSHPGDRPLFGRTGEVRQEAPR
jgi:hypothetical protein